jgi:acyl-CoA reductase-like NAD-dependent aldehyde dehydrogenase
MKTRETTTPVRAFDRVYINGQFVTPHGTQVVDLVNPTDNKVIGKVTMADEIDTRKAMEYIKSGIEEGAQLVIGGEGHPQGLEGGNFIKPTVFANVTREMRIAMS